MTPKRKITTLLKHKEEDYTLSNLQTKLDLLLRAPVVRNKNNCIAAEQIVVIYL